MAELYSVLVLTLYELGSRSNVDDVRTRFEQVERQPIKAIEKVRRHARGSDLGEQAEGGHYFLVACGA